MGHLSIFVTNNLNTNKMNILTFEYIGFIIVITQLVIFGKMIVLTVTDKPFEVNLINYFYIALCNMLLDFSQYLNIS